MDRKTTLLYTVFTKYTIINNNIIPLYVCM